MTAPQTHAVLSLVPLHLPHTHEQDYLSSALPVSPTGLPKFAMAPIVLLTRFFIVDFPACAVDAVGPVQMASWS